MSEWVDFGLYALQAVLLWIVLPAWGARFLRPLFTTAGNAGKPRGGIWLNALRAWGMLSVLLLLAYKLNKVPPPLSATSLRATGWEALLKTSNLMLALGMLPAILGARSLWHWLKDIAPLQQSAEDMLPRTRDEFLPRRLQYLVYTLLLATLIAGPIAGMIWPDRVQGVWGNFFTGLVMALLLFFAAAGSVLRAPNHLDRALGERYRSMEVRACYLLMTCLALLQIAGLALEIAGISSRRHVALLVSAFVSVTLASFMLLASGRQAIRNEGHLIDS